MNKYRFASAPVSLLDRLGFTRPPKRPISYVVEGANWATRWDGILVSRGIEEISPGLCSIVERPAQLVHSLVHFFSHYQWLAWGPWLARSNNFVATFYHGKPEDGAAVAREIDIFLASTPRLHRVVTSARIVETRLLDWGVPAEKIVRIPIPIDLSLFRPPTKAERLAARRRLGVPEGSIVVGSFQKDGVGWGNGLEPKLIKGPDVLIETLAMAARELPIFALLTGPARGYVKEGLTKAGVPFAHEFVADYQDLPATYAALDVYLNPSREEGGPKGILESMAMDIPVVSTRVGMAPDIIKHRVGGFLADPGDSSALARGIVDAVNLDSEAKALLRNARDAVARCSVDAVAAMHWQHIVRPFLAR